MLHVHCTCVFLQVCCHCFDLLTQLSTKATVQVNQVNAHLYTHVTDLSNVEVSVNSQAVGTVRRWAVGS